MYNGMKGCISDSAETYDENCDSFINFKIT